MIQRGTGELQASQPKICPKQISETVGTGKILGHVRKEKAKGWHENYAWGGELSKRTFSSSP